MKYAYAFASIALRLLILGDVVLHGHWWLLLVPLIYGALRRGRARLLNYLWIVAPLPLLDDRLPWWSWTSILLLVVVGMVQRVRDSDPNKPSATVVGPIWLIGRVIGYLFDAVLVSWHLPGAIKDVVLSLRSELPNVALALAVGAQRRGWNGLSLRLLGPAFRLARWAPNAESEGQAYHVRALVREELSGDWEGAISDLGVAERVIAGAGLRDSESLDRIRGDLRRLLGLDQAMAEVVGPKAMKDSPVAGQHMAYEAGNLYAVGKFEEAHRLLVAARQQVMKFRRNEQLVAAIDANLVRVELDLGKIKPTLAAERLHKLADYLDRQHDAEGAMGARVYEAEASLAGGDEIRASRLLEQVIERASARGLTEVQLLAMTRLVSILQVSDPPAALKACLVALCLTDGQRYQRSSTLARSNLVADMLPVQGAAMRLAYQLDESSLLVELIESCRLQAVPTSYAPGRHAGTRASRFLDLALGYRTFVSVGGVSRLAEVARELGSAEYNVLPIERLVAEKGTDGLLWSGWLADGAYHWALLSPAGVTATGCQEIATPGPIDDAIAALNAAVGVRSSEGAAGGMEKDALARTWIEEEALSRQLSDAILPLPLKEAIAARAAGRRAGMHKPLRLLIALPPSLSQLPVSLLTVSDHSPAVRLIEGATPEMVPPVRLSAELARRAQLQEAAYPVSLAVVDPTGDLTHARSVPPRSASVLSGHAEAAEFLRPTKAEVIKHLQGIGTGSASVLYYSGHFDAGSDGSLRSGLALADGTLTSEEILSRRDQADAIPFPCRVLLSACSSLSTTTAGTVDWTGFVTAMLLGGASTVIATSWDLLDSPFTTEVDHRIADMLSVSVDPAADLREIQLNYLDDWCSTVSPSQKAPVVWAAYQVIDVSPS